jgi:diguanylate cyclase (GGDEF)-like protein/PAS domain S-box-containing protein
METGKTALDREGNRWMAALVRASEDAVIGCSPQGIIRSWNPAAERLFGYAAEDAIGCPLTMLVAPEDRAEHELRLQTLSQGVAIRQARSRCVRWDGRPVEVSLSAAPVFAPEGAVAAIVGIVRDITEAAVAQRALEESEARLTANEAHLRMALDSALMWTFEFDVASGQLIRAGTPQSADGVGLARCVSLPDVFALVHPDDRLEMNIGYFPPVMNEETFVRAFRVRADDGTYRWVEARGRVTVDGEGRPDRVLGTVLDITKERQAEDRRQEAETTLLRTIEASTDAFVAFDTAGAIIGWNPAAERIFGWSAAEAVGQHVVDLLFTETLKPRFDALLERATVMAQAGGFTRGPVEAVARHRDGHAVCIEASWVSVLVDGAVRFTGFARDITERRQLQAQLEEQALTDPLTGLPNRALLHDRLAGALTRLNRRRGTVGVLFLDLDRFKVINDSLGHQAGDELLRAVGQRVAASLRAEDTLARFGGDELVVVVEHADRNDVVALGQRLLATVSEPVQLRDLVLTPTASIGIATADDSDRTADGLLRDADLAMYRAKANGGDCCEVFHPSMRGRAVARLEQEGELRAAIEQNQLKVHYQPYVAFDGVIAGVEALVRWQHPQRGLIFPGDFIGIAEETGLVLPLGAHVLSEACRQAATWRSAGHVDLRVSVNLSARQLAQPDLANHVAAALADAGLSPDALCLEITETALMVDPARAAYVLEEIHRLGVEIGLDDFGTGYSSLVYLRHFPVQVLKLDRHFVAGLRCNRDDTAIVGAAIDLAHSLGLVAIAEGVETAAQCQDLIGLGCDLFQGFYWSPPVDAARVTALLEGGRLVPTTGPGPIRLLPRSAPAPRRPTRARALD